jgi:hypothetical protein
MRKNGPSKITEIIRSSPPGTMVQKAKSGQKPASRTAITPTTEQTPATRSLLRDMFRGHGGIPPGMIPSAPLKRFGDLIGLTVE